MLQNEFTDGLPQVTACGVCKEEIRALHWSVSAFAPGEWFGVCIARCESCRWFRVAASGSSDAAHQKAQQIRAQLMRAIDVKGVSLG